MAASWTRGSQRRPAAGASCATRWWKRSGCCGRTVAWSTRPRRRWRPAPGRGRGHGQERRAPRCGRCLRVGHGLFGRVADGAVVATGEYAADGGRLASPTRTRWSGTWGCARWWPPLRLDRGIARALHDLGVDIFTAFAQPLAPQPKTVEETVCHRHSVNNCSSELTRSFRERSTDPDRSLVTPHSAGRIPGS